MLGAVALCATWSGPALADSGLQLAATQNFDSRLSELTFQTSALASGVASARVLLPTNYDPSGRTRYPVLYLLNGALGNQTDWTVQGNAEALTAGLPLIVVMPNGGSVGMYADWYNDGAGGQPEWETFHIGQLVPWIDSHFPTLGTRSGRAIAGLSMGGGGAMGYAARHPDLFVAAASFSGADDTSNPGMQGVVQGGGLADGSHSPGAIFGLRQTDEIRWHGHNATDLAANLAGLRLGIYTGNGEAGGPCGDAGDPVEMDVHQQSLDLHWALQGDGIPHVFDDYGAGGHSWCYWQRDLGWTLPWLMATFNNPPRVPSPFDFTAVEPSYDVYGWHVAIERPALEFSELRDVRASGFELRGSGTGTVTTASLYRPGSTLLATVRSQSGTTTQALVADAQGRVTVTVPLGPGNAYQEYSPQAQASTAAYAVQRAGGTWVSGSPGTIIYTARVDLTAG
jgi:S-formylglutathione hydrolase FrmB